MQPVRDASSEYESRSPQGILNFASFDRINDLYGSSNKRRRTNKDNQALRFIFNRAKEINIIIMLQ